MIEVITTSTCTPCKMVKVMLESKGLEYKAYVMDTEELPPHLPDVKTVPAIFLDSNLIGYGAVAVKKLEDALKTL